MIFQLLRLFRWKIIINLSLINLSLIYQKLSLLPILSLNLNGMFLNHMIYGAYHAFKFLFKYDLTAMTCKTEKGAINVQKVVS